MKYFVISLLFIALAFFGTHFAYRISPDYSRSSGRDQSTRVDKTEKQAQEDRSIFHTQRQGGDRVPRAEDEVKHHDE